jgi:hypothetical protein
MSSPAFDIQLRICASVKLRGIAHLPPDSEIIFVKYCSQTTTGQGRGRGALFLLQIRPASEACQVLPSLRDVAVWQHSLHKRRVLALCILVRLLKFVALAYRYCADVRHLGPAKR